MTDLQFRCFKCQSTSAMNITAENRDHVARLGPDPNARRDVTFYCDKCGSANTVEITIEAVTRLLERMSSNDPEIQKAINDARRGNYASAIDQARKRFGF